MDIVGLQVVGWVVVSLLMTSEGRGVIDPVTCDEIDFPCSCKTVTDVGSDYPLLDIDCEGQELVRVPDMAPLRPAKIYKLDLSDNHIRYINASAFAGLEFRPERKNAILRLSGNPVEYISPQAFRGLKATTIVLEMKGMKLETFPFESLKQIPGLTQLHLGGNKLTHIPPMAFHGLKELENLNLEDNLFKVLPRGVFRDQVDSLEILRLRNTGIDELPLDEIVKLKKLTKLNLKENKISYLPSGLLESLHEDVREIDIDLSHNQLTEIQYDVFAREVSTRKPIKAVLTLNSNQIQSLAFIEDPCKTMFRKGSVIKAHRNPVFCTCELYSIIQVNYYLIDVICETPVDYKGMLVYASTRDGMSEASLEYERKVQQDCSSRLRHYDLHCIQAKKPPAAVSACPSCSTSILALLPICILSFVNLNIP